MNSERSDQELINLPTTVDFMVRSNEIVENFIRSNPKIISSQSLAEKYSIVYVNQDDFGEAIQSFGTSIYTSSPFVLGLLDQQSIESAGITQVHELPNLNLRGKGVLVGIVDTGIDYTLPVFRYENGASKIQYIYDQTSTSNPPNGFIFGTEYNNAKINAALRSENPFDLVPQQDTVGHGTFLASVAAGRQVGDFVGAAPESELIVVKLRNAKPFYREKYLVPPDQQNAYQSTDVMIGVEFIVKKARELNRPVAICIGVGTNLGSHDGYSLFEEYLNGISIINGVCLCEAAGNEGLANHHTVGVLSKSGEQNDIEIRVGNTINDIYLSILNEASDRLSVSITSPMGEAVGRISASPGSITESKLVFGGSSVTVEYNYPLEGSGGQSTVVKIRNATPGIWDITVYGEIVLNGTYHAYLPIAGFISPDVEFVTPNSYYTVVVPATMFGAISCGSYNSNNNSLNPNSSIGPTRLPLLAPLLLAPGVGVGGYFPTGYGTADGTSVSAAITTGACALMLQWGIVEKKDLTLSTYKIRAYLIRGCNQNESYSYPNVIMGYGSLNLNQSFMLMKEL